ncbi:MAG: hypothetical protein AAGD13_09290 [Pseudomonadota bacterium]
MGFQPLVAMTEETLECSALTALAEQATAEILVPNKISALEADLSAQNCGTAITQRGRREIHCRWSFDYRAEAAIAFQDHVASRLRECLSAVDVAPEQGVNHPDTYDQQQFRADDLGASLSRKDKAAINATLIFLRVGGV